MQTLSRPQLAAKAQEAIKVIEGCRRDCGFHASTRNYPQLWNRDLVYSMDSLLELGYSKEVKAQLSEFIRHQRRNGRIPTSIRESERFGKIPSFHSWTSDTEMLFVIGMIKYAKFASDQSFLEQNLLAISRCLGYIDRHLDKHGLIPGMDWRDAMSNYMGKYLLANQMLLVEMYDALGMTDRSSRLRETVNVLFYSEEHGFYADSVSWRRSVPLTQMHLDSLGNSLAILNHTADRERSKSVLSALEGARTQFGYVNITPPYEINKKRILLSPRKMHAFILNGAYRRNDPYTYQNSTIWPFVESRVVAAMKSAKADEKAEFASSIMAARRAMNEVYSPKTGEPQESEGQLWTAAAIISLLR